MFRLAIDCTLIFELYVVCLYTCLYKETGLIFVVPKHSVTHNMPLSFPDICFRMPFIYSPHFFLWNLFLGFFFLLHFHSPQETSLPSYCHWWIFCSDDHDVQVLSLSLSLSLSFEHLTPWCLIVRYACCTL